MRGLHGISMGFAAGAVGGLICSLVIWFCGEIGITAAYDVKIHPQLTFEWLYPRIVWGGCWGTAFVMPYLQTFTVLRGAVISLLPSAFQLFVVFPIFMNKGVMGAKLGEMTPLFILCFNAIWGVTAGYWLKIARG